MILTQDVEKVWKRMVRRGEVVSRSKDGEDIVEIGIRMDGDVPRYYANRYGASKVVALPGKIWERKIGGTNFVVQYNHFRAYRPGAKKERRDGVDSAPEEGGINADLVV